MRHHLIDQNTDEWMSLRCGILTGSAMGKVMANDGKSFGQPAKDYAVQLAIERITGVKELTGFSNHHTERGHQEEPIARALYEDEYFCDVSPGGFFEDGEIGCSPDGLVYDDGLIEIKSVIPTVHYKTVKRGGIDPSYKWQVYSNLMITGRAWIDFISYCSAYPAGNRLYTYRVYAADCAEIFERINTRVGKFLSLVGDIVAQINMVEDVMNEKDADNK